MPFVWIMCPETSGKSLEEIDLLFAKDAVKESVLAEGIIHREEDEDKHDGSVKVEKV